MDFTSITDALNQIPTLDKSLYGSALVLGVLLRFARAGAKWFDAPHTIIAAILMGAVGAGLEMTVANPQPAWQVIGTQSITLGVAVLVVERLLHMLSAKVKWIPSDNAYIKSTDTEEPKP